MSLRQFACTGMRAPTLLAVMTWLLHDPVARWLVVAAVGAMVVGEVVATHLGQARDGERRLLGSLAESLLYVRRRRDGAVPQDGWTKWIAVFASRVGLVGSAVIAALVPGGPYRLLRHPSCSGISLAFGGLGLALGSWVSATVALLIIFVGMLPRIRVEERALAQASPLHSR